MFELVLVGLIIWLVVIVAGYRRASLKRMSVFFLLLLALKVGLEFRNPYSQFDVAESVRSSAIMALLMFIFYCVGRGLATIFRPRRAPPT